MINVVVLWVHILCIAFQSMMIGYAVAANQSVAFPLTFCIVYVLYAGLFTYLMVKEK